MKTMIDRKICEKILMIGLYYKDAKGGMASVIQYYEPHFNKLNYIYSWKSPGKLNTLYYFIRALCLILLELLFNKKIRVVHIHAAADGSFIRAKQIVKICKLFNKKVILHIHASRFKDFYDESSNKAGIIKILNVVDKLIVLSNSWKEWFVSCGVLSEKIIVLNNITSNPQLSVIERHEKLNLLFLGLLGPRKGVFDLIDAIAKDKELFENKICLKIGGNTHEDELKTSILDNKLNSFVKFEGWVSGQHKIDLLNWADVYILPSYNEGLPIGILEAMSYNCAIISTPVGGISEVVKNGYNGIIVEPGNIKQISDAIYQLCDKKVLESMKENQKDIIKDFLPDSVIAHLEKIYIDLI